MNGDVWGLLLSCVIAVTVSSTVAWKVSNCLQQRRQRSSDRFIEAVLLGARGPDFLDDVHAEGDIGIDVDPADVRWWTVQLAVEPDPAGAPAVLVATHLHYRPHTGEGAES